MKKKLTFLLFGLLLAVGWTNGVQAQELRSESLAKVFIKAAVAPKPVLSETKDVRGSHNHSHAPMAVESQTRTLKATDMKTAHKISEFGAQQAVKKEATRPSDSRPSSRYSAPLRAGQELPMESITKADADQMTYTWTDGGGASHTSAATEVAKDPYQMYELLRFVYMDKRFPGPYYSAYTKNDERERKVYYGAIEGGWNIGGDALSGTSLTNTVTVPINVIGSKLVADGTATNEYVPVYGYWYDANTQKNQMIYPASMLGLEDGTVLTSITFYTYRKYWYGGTVKLSLGETTTTTFSGNTLLNATVTEVKSAFTPPSTQGAIEWKIEFDQPYTYHGGNLLVQVETTRGSYGSSGSAFYGVNNTGYSSCNSYNNANVTRRQFLPKATFGYKVTGEREVTYDPTYQIGDIVISGTNNYAAIRSVTVTSGNTTLFSWNGLTDGVDSGDFPAGWELEEWMYGDDVIAFTEDLHAITLSNWLFAGYNSVTVSISGFNMQSASPASLIVNGQANNITTPYSSSQGALETKTWTINAQNYPYTEYDPDYYLPTQEGYTALIVAVKNVAPGSDYSNFEADYDNDFYSTKQEIVDYLAANVDSIKLLTDGMRIGEGSDYSIGTLFNCEGTYNKFFFLGKGQAKQKPDIVREREIFRQHLHGELVPFRYMFEQFSPTSGAVGSQTTDFYSKMMEGNVYPVVHDCRSVIELEHQFSMSGNAGTTAYAMTGMNFFIPDYRLKYWETEVQSTIVDGRITNPYQGVSADGNPKLEPSLALWSASNFSFWYAQYNQDYAPKVGLYKITLDATATQVAQDHTPGNRNYAVTLHWVSSLNEMTGHEVPQTYTLYFWDPVTGERKFLVVEGVTTVNGETNVTTLTYYVEQFATSYVLDYIVYGSPDDTEHQQFVAVSNIDGVVIPGWDDFVGLELDHHESDFEAGDMANYYRNFLAAVNEDIYNGLTVAQVTGYNGVPQMNTFNLYRWAIKDGAAQGEEKVAVLEFDKANATKVHYNIYYKDENHSDLTEQDILASKYSRSAMGIQDEGWVRVKDNGDLVIWPNGYHVNFKSITVKENGNVVTSWNAETMNTLPSGWIVSPGSKWEEFTTSATSDKVGYMEGGGYIAIPDMLNNHSSLTVEIEAYGDGAAVTRIAVNDDSKLIANTAGTTYTWTVNAPTTGSKAPNRAATTITWDFEEQSDLDGWSIYDSDGDGDNWGWYDGTQYQTTWNCHSGYGVMYSQSYNPATGAALTPDNWLISPEVTLGGSLTLWAIGQDANYAEEKFSIMVYEGSSFSNTSDFVQVGATITTTGTWTQYSFDLSQFEGQGYFVIRHHGVRDKFRLLIDDVELTLPDSGETPPDPTDPTTLEPTDAGLLRLHLLMVDQFKEEIPDDNKHPEAYGYVLRYEPEQGESKQSGKPDVRIEKTKAKVNGYYTKAEIDGDTDAGLTLNVLTADVEMDLDNENPDILYFEMKGKKDAAPASSDPYLTKLQYMKNIGMYEEMEETSPNKGRHYDPEETHHYFDDSTPIVTGNYGINFMTYAPMVSTWGIDRRYYEDDGLDNTYGAPIWKNSVGKAEVKTVTLEKQVASDGSALSSVSWLDGNDQPCSLYILDKITADGYLPSSDVTNVEYVPYMFRIYVESPTGMLRGFIPHVPGTTTNPGTNAQNDPSFNNFNGPWCVYEENVEDAQVVDLEGGKGVVWQKMKDDSDWANNAVFGALSSMIQGTQNSATFNPDDLTVYVRFYYMVKDSNAKNRAGEARPGNGSQSPGFEPSPWTTVGEIKYVGDVVSVTYVNPLGMTSDRPFNGINIVLTRYSNGTTSTSKVMY